MQVVDPVACHDLYAGDVLEDVEEGDIALTLFRRRTRAVAGPGPRDQLRSSHVIQSARPTRRVSPDDAFGELRVQSPLHTLGVSLIPTLNVVEGGLPDRRRIGDRLSRCRGDGPEQESRKKSDGDFHWCADP